MPREEKRTHSSTARRSAQAARKATHEATHKAAQPLTLAVVGAGRLGSALAFALAAAGYRVKAVVTRRKQHARRIAKLFPHPTPLALAANELAALPPTDLLLIATPDDQIAATAARLAAIAHERSDTYSTVTRRKARVALHTSGALSSNVLAPMRAAGFAVGSLHPLVSVSDTQAGTHHLRGAYFCVEGDAVACRLARKLVLTLAGHSLALKPTDKALYHAAAVLASGHTVALFDLATLLFARCGIAPNDARCALLPLTASTLLNLRATDSNTRALTGPFARGDAATVRANLAALVADPLALRIYALLGTHALQLATQKGLPAVIIKEIAAVLDRELAS